MQPTINKIKSIDILKTERLILTPLNIKDANRYIDIAKNMRKVKQENPNYFLYVRFDHNVENLKKAVKDLLTSTEKSKFPEVAKRFNICLKDNTIIGYIGFLYSQQNKINSDLGVFLDPPYEHKGYAYEAQISLLSYYFVNYDDKIYLTIHPENMPSYQLNIKCGAVKIAHTSESKYGSERDILIITRQKFLETVFDKQFKSAQEEKQFLLQYLKIYNKF